MAEQARAGLDVGVALDLTQSRNAASQHRKIQRAGGTVTVKRTGILEHNKFCVVDGVTVLMGSWNWSARAQAQDNSDILFTDCPTIAARFEAAYASIVARDRKGAP
jgi:phosphatidylserine/phosphatidylglycerophosphate/cardiolipin synthase-like enzyme